MQDLIQEVVLEFKKLDRKEQEDYINRLRSSLADRQALFSAPQGKAG